MSTTMSKPFSTMTTFERQQANEIHAITEQRDELLAALERFAAFDGCYAGGETMDYTDHKFNVDNLQREARAVIAKCKAGA